MLKITKVTSTGRSGDAAYYRFYFGDNIVYMVQMPEECALKLKEKLEAGINIPPRQVLDSAPYAELSNPQLIEMLHQKDGDIEELKKTIDTLAAELRSK